MNKFEEFMASMASKRKKTVNEKSETGGGLKTSDGKEFDCIGVDAIKTALCGCPLETLKDIGKVELFDRLAENFIKANTKQDLDSFVKHQLIIKLAKIIFR